MAFFRAGENRDCQNRQHVVAESHSLQPSTFRICIETCVRETAFIELGAASVTCVANSSAAVGPTEAGSCIKFPLLCILLG